MARPVLGDVTRLSVFGDVTAEDGAPLMRAILQAVAGSGDRRVVVDLTDAHILDDEIIEVLVSARHAARVVCRDLTFAGAPSNVRAQLRHHDQSEPLDGRTGHSWRS
ncbi:STAS domain-containing protein [Longispora fulva]|uniref:Anti-anti-sigma regulatory factor n=1 Tax=Longispora fulva TaxID=619741 RepID=A0A8J7KJM9_9ACTN|nr:STAS domain-containing protein [Longispora fulva]MBG6135621.1 anti-anti-sigma regulatory factor [Longispora fulva]